MKVLSVLMLFALAACGGGEPERPTASVVAAPEDFRFLGEMAPCHLNVAGSERFFRVNCFHLDGVLHIHSNRFAKLPRFSGENWVETVRRDPRVRVQIEDRIHHMLGTPIDDEERRVAILESRGYSYAWDGITVVGFRAP